ncbi:MAG: hypothetical protein AAF585_25765, partial [Verrucomicrobiota bacterium]
GGAAIKAPGFLSHDAVFCGLHLFNDATLSQSDRRIRPKFCPIRPRSKTNALRGMFSPQNLEFSPLAKPQTLFFKNA